MAKLQAYRAADHRAFRDRCGHVWLHAFVGRDCPDLAGYRRSEHVAVGIAGTYYVGDDTGDLRARHDDHRVVAHGNGELSSRCALAYAQAAGCGTAIAVHGTPPLTRPVRRWRHPSFACNSAAPPRRY